jgi:polysaccharide deacetylase family protein (PEP-CTERM system associated)
MLNILSIDVEEYFHPTEVQPFVHEDWSALPSRVERQTMQILELFAQYNVSATFFVVGWVAEKHPNLVQAIAAAGHEIGCHSYLHRLVYDLNPQEFRNDTELAMKAIFDACGVRVRTYRAPSYSITKECMWALDILAELGFTHDSSIYPIVHDRYGIPGFERHAHVIPTASGGICEVPIATIKFSNGRTAPVGGGGYLRLLPYRYTAAGIRKLNIEEQHPACIYFHPWEIDPDQPHLAGSLIARMRTYTGLHSMFSKIERLLTEFKFGTMTRVHPITEPVTDRQPLAAFA